MLAQLFDLLNIKKYTTYFAILALAVLNPHNQNKNLICKISDSTVTPLFIYINGEFKPASIVFYERDEFNPYSSPLIDFKALHCYSLKGDYIGIIDVSEITFQELGCVYAVVGRTKTKLPSNPRPLFCLGKLSYQKRFYKNSQISPDDTIYALDKAVQIIQNFLNENSLKIPQTGSLQYQARHFKIINILKFDINADDTPEIFARVECEIGGGYKVITSLALSDNELLYLSTTCINSDGKTMFGDMGVVYFEFVADIDGDLIAEVITTVGYYESWDYQLLKLVNNKLVPVATAIGGGC
ncbi:hypothetical protein JGI3_02406 [Candidatus Kryptobacter tengchongensis]|nr:hypothetical protein JGI3_02406 [Candidatus Kryptobacter tengchongensis]